MTEIGTDDKQCQSFPKALQHFTDDAGLHPHQSPEESRKTRNDGLEKWQLHFKSVHRDAAHPTKLCVGRRRVISWRPGQPAQYPGVSNPATVGAAIPSKYTRWAGPNKPQFDAMTGQRAAIAHRHRRQWVRNIYSPHVAQLGLWVAGTSVPADVVDTGTASR